MGDRPQQGGIGAQPLCPLPANGKGATGSGCRDQTNEAICSKLKRGLRGKSFEASPNPMLIRTLDFTSVPAKNSASTLAESKPTLGPVSSPTARKARIR